MARRAADFRLDTRVAALCAEDIQTTCSREVATMTAVEGSDGRVLHCLQDYVDELKARLRALPLGSRAFQGLRFAGSRVLKS